jgi:hypothetical protein
MLKELLFLFFFSFLLHFTNAAVFTSVANGTYASASTWSLTSGTDSDGVPDFDDDVIVNHAVTIGGTSTCASLVVNAGGAIVYSPGKSLVCRGNLTNSGTFTNSGVLYIDNWASTASITVSSTTTISNTLVLRLRTNGKTINIAAGTNFSNLKGIIVDGTGGGTANNFGNLSVTASGGGGLTLNASTNFINQANSSLTVTSGIVVNSGTFTASANPNTVTYTSTFYSTIRATTYHNLVISNGSTATVATKTLAGNIITNGNLSINSNVALNCSGFNITCTGNWTHSGTLASGNLTNLGTITFNGTTQTLTRSGGTEVLGNVVVNPSTSLTLGSNLTATNLTLSSGTFDLSASNFTVNVSGNLVINALLNARDGTFNFNGAVAQTISGSGTPTFANMTINNAAGVSVTSSIACDNLISVTTGSFGPSGLGSIRLAANSATDYGRIGPVSGTLTGSNWRIESFVSTGPANWTWLSTPVNGNLLSDWDNDTRFYMSGIGGNDGTACCPTFFSVRTYNTSNNTYTNITSANHVLVRGRGYRVYMSDNMTSLTSPLIYNSVGIPNFSSVPSPTLAAGGTGNGWNLVGNPYACPITFSTLAAANTNINASGFMILQDNGSYATNPNSGVISPNQGFMVNTTLNGSTMSFTEACKNTTSFPNLIRTAAPQDNFSISVTNNFNGLGSQTSIAFSKDAKDDFDSNDLPYLSNLFEEADNIWTSTEGFDQLILNQNSNDGKDKIIPLTVKAGVTGTHSLIFNGINSVVSYNCVWLEDLTTGERIDVGVKSNYDFHVNSIDKEYPFLVHFENREGCKIISESTFKNEFFNTLVYNNGTGVVVKFGFSEPVPVTVSVHNLIGQEIMPTQQINAGNDFLRLSIPQENQLYFVTLRSGDQIVTRKIVY